MNENFRLTGALNLLLLVKITMVTFVYNIKICSQKH